MSGALERFIDEISRLSPSSEELFRSVNAFLLESTNICDLCRSMRTRNDLGNDSARIPRRYRGAILRSMARRLALDEPPHIVFAGTKESSLQLPAIALTCTAAYTFSMWVNIDADSPPRGFLLFRCRCSTGGMDAMVTDRQAADSRWLITLRSYSGAYEKATEKDETRNLYMQLIPGQWHLLCFVHTAPSSVLVNKGKVTVYVDGVPVGKRDDAEHAAGSRENTQSALLYPFTSAPAESHWKHAVGFKGKFASSAFYTEELSAAQITFLYSLGPYVPHHAHGINFPQNSFDTGHAVLGSLYSKVVPIAPAFCWTAHHLQGSASLPLVPAGRFNVEHIDMTASQERPQALIPFLHGPSEVVARSSCVDSWAAAGGVYLIIYLLWDHCSTAGKQAEAETEAGSHMEEGEEEGSSGFVFVGASMAPATSQSRPPYSPSRDTSTHECLLAILDVLAGLIALSADFKEQLVQVHGFHLIAHCLALVPRALKRSCLDSRVVDACLRLVRAMGPDASRGDGLASALQGLLLDFRVWRDCALITKRHLLEAVIELVTPCSEQLFRGIGVQAVLDLLRLHLCEAAGADPNPGPDHDPEPDAPALLASCADAGAKLLQLVFDAAREYASRHKADHRAGDKQQHPQQHQLFQHEPELLLACLDEGRSSVVAERVLRVLGSMRASCPAALLRVLVYNRYAETTALALLTGRGLSMALRRDALLLLLWGLGEYLRQVPTDLIHLRNAKGSMAAPPPPEPKKTLQGRRVSNVLDEARAARGGAGEGRAAKSSRSREIARPIEEAWLAVTVLAECIDRAISDGSWGDVTAPSAQSPYEEVVCVLAHDGPLGAVNVWAVLPLLGVLLRPPRCSLSTCQRILMSANVALKMDEAQCEALGTIADKAWCRLFVDLACLGETHRASIVSVSAAAAVAGTAGLPPAAAMQRDVADTCTELALDALSTVLEQKTRHHAYESHDTWACVQSSLAAGCSILEDAKGRAVGVEGRFLKRIVSLVFQRLARSSEGWNATLISSVVNILTLVEQRNLCSSRAPSAAAPRPQQTPDEQQILCFMHDLVSGLRRASAHGALEGIERRALRPATRISLGCLRSASDEMADRLCVEIMASLQFMSEPWGAPAGPNGDKSFREFMVLVFNALRAVIDDRNVDEGVRARYSALVYHIMHHFIDLRHNLGRGAHSVPTHVLPMLDALTDVDTQREVGVIFRMLAERLDLVGEEAGEEGGGEGHRENDAAAMHAPGGAEVASGLSAGSVEEAEDAGGSSSSSTGDLLDGFPDLSSLLGAAEHGAGEGLGSLDSFGSVSSSALSPSLTATPTLGQLLDFGDGGLVDGLASSPSAAPSFSASASAARAGEPGGSLVRMDTPDPDLDPELAAALALHTRWLSVRRGILSDRADSERARLARAATSVQVAAEATARHWARLHRKIETEYFFENTLSDWKLGVSHEGPFPGRRRVILRPRYRKVTGLGESSSVIPRLGMAGPRNEAPQDVLIVGRELAKVYRSSSGAGKESDGTGHDHDQGEGEDGPETEDERPGTGWGLVDADGSEEGFGVVGIASALRPRGSDPDSSHGASPPSPPPHSSSSSSSSSASSSAPASTAPATLPSPDGDLTGDVRQIDEAYYPGRGPETGPALPGTRKMGASRGLTTIEARVMLVTASGNTWGTLSFNGREIFFASRAEGARRDEGADSASVNLASVPRMRRRRWALSTVSAVYLRRYRLRSSAIEVFFRRGKHRNFFVDFGHTEEDEKSKNAFAEALMHAAPKSAFLQWPHIGNFSLVRLHGVQGKWLNGEMSNFDYLMALNTISGRSFNDLCQYPVMPWVIAQYTRGSLDLSDPASFRDLSKPMGALEEGRLREFLDRYDSFQESGAGGEMPAFMYGSHYSTMVGVVLHFLMRVQPFADLHREMQGGHFDVADRLFSSIPRTWLQNTTQLSEVKELTPEWFTTPEVFKNINKFDLGRTQDGEVINDVVLPPWASSADEFVRLNREALESDYVSAHLHEWIDLIFGYKQQLPHSEKAHNVFFYLTYADLVDWKTLSKDDALRSATELQISHFGQTPLQLFNMQHPKRGATFFSRPIPRTLRKCFGLSRTNRPLMAVPNSVEEAASSGARTIVVRAAAAAAAGAATAAAPSSSSSSSAASAPHSPAVALSVTATRVIMVLESGDVEVMKFGVTEGARGAIAAAASRNKHRAARDGESPDSTPLPPSVTADVVASLPEPLLALERESPPAEVLARVPMPSNLPSECLAAVVLVTPSGRYVLSAGKVDGSVCVRELDARSGFVKSQGDFCSHRCPVLHLAADTIPNATTDVIASCDASGLVFVWTVSEIRHQIGQQIDLFARESVISRRPQRLFRCRPSSHICCDVSCRMGVVVACCGAEVHVFSIERDERLRLFVAAPPAPAPSAEPGAGEPQAASPQEEKRSIRRLSLCNDGLVTMHVEVWVSPLIEGFETAKEHHLEVYSLSGSFVAARPVAAAVTFLQCPSREDVLLSGHADGTVNVWCSHNLQLLYSFCPHASFAAPAGGASVDSPLPSAVVCVKAGPAPDRPTLLAVSCASGLVYLRPLPDFIKWERQRNPSALSQLVERPLEVVRGTIQHAHQMGSTLQANVQGLAVNASRLADDALAELKKNAVVKSISGFFKK